MPLYAPRTEPIKKREQLLLREKELHLAIKNNFSNERINKVAEKYRVAQLAFFKARLHEIHDLEFQKKKNTVNISKIENSVLEWNKKNVEEIIDEIKAKKIFW